MISELEMQDLTEVATVIACAMENGIISLFRRRRDGEGQEACSIVTDVRCAAASRELLWIDEPFLTVMPSQ
jgi:hypothetical protein